MAATPLDPDEVLRFEVQIFDGDDRLAAKRFSTLAAAEAYADAGTDEVPGRRAVIEDVAHHLVLDEEVQADTALVEDYPHAGQDDATAAPYD